MKSINTDKEKTDLVKKVSKMCLSRKEQKLFEKVLEKGFKAWNEFDTEFLMLLYDIHYYPCLSAGGIDIIPFNQQDDIKREIEAKKGNALKRLTEDPYALWFKNARNYK